MFPERRKKGLIIQSVDDETIILDKQRNKAHCLNATASLVWQHCDGKSSLAQLAATVEAALGSPFSDEDVLDAIANLQRARLLEPSVEVVRRERRRMVRKLATAGLAAIVTSIVVPTPAMAATGLPTGACCIASAQCASGNCNGLGNPHCPTNPPCATGKCCV